MGSVSPVGGGGGKAGSKDKLSGGMSELTDVKKLLSALANSGSDKVLPSRSNKRCLDFSDLQMYPTSY